MKAKGQLLAFAKAAVPPSIKARIKRRKELTPTPAAVWNQEFGAGKWDFLGSAAEMPRYAVIAGYFGALPENPAVLDVGCGAGLLQPWLKRIGYARYLGIDLSETAIVRAQAQADAQTRFEAADAESFVLPETFDVIILNEMLYYMADPVGMLRRYAAHLRRDGVFILSLWDCRESVRAWNASRKVLAVLDEARVAHAHLSWRIRVCRLA